MRCARRSAAGGHRSLKNCRDIDIGAQHAGGLDDRRNAGGFQQPGDGQVVVAEQHAEAADADRPGAAGEFGDQHRGDAAPLPVVEDRDRKLGDLRLLLEPNASGQPDTGIGKAAGADREVALAVDGER